MSQWERGEKQRSHIIAIWNYFLIWHIFKDHYLETFSEMKRAKQKCNQNAPVPFIPLYSLSSLNDVMKIFGFLTGFPLLTSHHNMMSLDNSVKPSHCFWSTKVINSISLSADIKFSAGLCGKPSRGSGEHFPAHFSVRSPVQKPGTGTEQTHFKQKIKSYKYDNHTGHWLVVFSSVESHLCEPNLIQMVLL